ERLGGEASSAKREEPLRLSTPCGCSLKPRCGKVHTLSRRAPSTGSCTRGLSGSRVCGSISSRRRRYKSHLVHYLRADASESGQNPEQAPDLHSVDRDVHT